MRFMNILPVLALLIVSVLCNIEVRRGGWLNRIVQYHKAKFLEDFRQTAPIKLNVTIVRTPEGYKDSEKWDLGSVIHLLILIKQSEPAAPVRRALRRMLVPTRRLMMGREESYKHFPSLAKGSMNEFYYDYDDKEETKEVDIYGEEIPLEKVLAKPKDSGVIVISNPVEAKLPSATISIKLLEEILVNRAIAARQVPSSTPVVIPWITMNTTDYDGDVVLTESTDLEEASGDDIDGTSDPVTDDVTGDDMGSEPPTDEPGENVTDGQDADSTASDNTEAITNGQGSDSTLGGVNAGTGATSDTTGGAPTGE